MPEGGVGNQGLLDMLTAAVAAATVGVSALTLRAWAGLPDIRILTDFLRTSIHAPFLEEGSTIEKLERGALQRSYL